MILHFLADDKFSDYVIKQFRTTEMASEFVIVSWSEEIKFVQETGTANIVKYKSESFYSLVKDLGRYKAIILHGLFWEWDYDILVNVPDNVKVAWMFWGGEIYGRPDLKASFYAPRTKRQYWVKRLKRLVKGTNHDELNYQLPIGLFKRIDYCLTDIEEEYSFAKQYIGADFIHLWYNYYSIEETIGNLIDTSCIGNNILVGNSSSLECNHLDALACIKDTVPNQKIICPLSYGETWLRNLIAAKGHKLFGSSFLPLVDFIPRQEYNSLLSSCSSAIMAHYRPQGLGNIITLLWMGTKVYMSKSSMQYSYLKRIGLTVLSIEEDLKHCSKEPFSRLDNEQMIQNRSILHEVYGADNMDKKNHELVNILNS